MGVDILTVGNLTVDILALHRPSRSEMGSDSFPAGRVLNVLPTNMEGFAAASS
jgi:hypothetical protein